MTHKEVDIYGQIFHGFQTFLDKTYSDIALSEITKKDLSFFWKKKSQDKDVKDSIRVFLDEKIVFLDYVFMMMYFPDIVIEEVNVKERIQKMLETDKAEEVLKIMTTAFNEWKFFSTQLSLETEPNFELRLFNYGNIIRITQLNKDYENKLVTIRGIPIIRSRESILYPVRKEWLCMECKDIYTQFINEGDPEPKKLKRKCRNVIKHPQDQSKDFQCGGKSWKDMGVKEYKEIYTFTVESITEDTLNRMSPSLKLIEFSNNLVKEFFVTNINMHSSYEWTGYVRIKSVGKKTEQKIILLEVMSFQELQKEDKSVIISETERDELKKFLVADDSLDKASKIFGTRAVGFYNEKKAFILMKVLQERFNKVKAEKPRDWLLHMLICGDFGVGKSELAEVFMDICTNPYYLTASSTTGVGLGGATVKNEMTGEYGIQAGIYTRASGDIIILEEFDKKQNPEDLGILNEGMSKFQFTIAKADKYRKFKANTIVIVIANPIKKNFDLNQPLLEQINIAGDLLSRFSFISAVTKPDDIELEFQINRMMIQTMSEEQAMKDKMGADFIKKCIKVASDTNVKINESMLTEKINEFTKQISIITKQNITEEDKSFWDSLTPRHRKTLIIVTKAVAMWHCHPQALEEDFDEAQKLIYSYWGQFIKNPIFMNLREIQSGQTMKQVEEQIRIAQSTTEWEYKKEKLAESNTGKYKLFMMYLKKIQEDSEEGVEMTILSEFARTELKLNSVEFDLMVSKLKTNGDIFEPKNGCLRML